MKSNKKLLVIIIVIIVAIVIIGAMVILNSNNNGESNNNGTKVTEELDILKEGYAIKTPVGDLYYPETWKDSIKENINKEDGYSSTIYGLIGDKEIEIFTLYIGADNASGHYFGTIKGDKVYIDIVEFEPDNSWEKEEKQMIYDMQEDVNYIIEQLYEHPDFEETNN